MSDNVSPTQHPKMARQIQLEEEIVKRGVERYRSAAADAREGGHESTTPHGQSTIRAQLEPFADAINMFLARTYCPGRGGSRRFADTGKYLRLLTPEECAFIAAKTILDHVALRKMFQTTAIAVGMAIQDECEMRYYRGENAKLFDAIMVSPKLQGQRTAYVRKLVRRSMTTAKTAPVAKWKEWPDRDRLLVGRTLIELFEKSTGVIETKKIRKRKHRTPYRIMLTDEASKWIAKVQSMSEILTPAYMYSVVPKDWTSSVGGGFWTKRLQDRVSLVKPHVLRTHRNYLEDLRHTEMPMVYRAINAIQNTAWSLDRRVYETLVYVWEHNLELGKLPKSSGEYELPEYPFNVPHDAECKVGRRSTVCSKHHRQQWKEWKAHNQVTFARVSAARSDVHGKNEKLFSRRIQVAQAIWVGKQIIDNNDEVIYFPHQLDFRGRIYPVSMAINPQASDYSKALLRFAVGKAITKQEHADWLAIHGANCYGYDKEDLPSRVRWVEEYEEQIIACASDPYANKFWVDADKPWQFLAFCFEWSEFKRQGWGFESTLPVSIDGTCNGLQHFSAMLRDEVGGKATNLEPSPRPQDIYQWVADVAIEKLKMMDDPLAQQWLTYGINRKTVKRSVMVLPYGGTLHACRRYIEAHVVERSEGGDTTFEENLRAATSFLANIVWQSIGEVVVKARVAMAWLQKTARKMAKKGVPITWTTPVGFPVVQAYPNFERYTVKTLFHGRSVYLKLYREASDIKAEKQVTAISPNFVHSMDAAALMLSVCWAQHQIDAFAMVHDSYGTRAADMDTLRDILRRAFVEMYQKHDVLVEFRDSAVQVIGEDVDPVPSKGSLDIVAVLDSEFFFA